MKKRLIAVIAIVLFGCGKSSDVLIEELKTEASVSEDSFRSHELSTVIADIGPSVVPKIVPLLSDPNPNVRNAGADIIREMGPAGEGAVPALLSALRKSAEKKLKALEAARDREPRSPPPYINTSLSFQSALSAIGPAATPAILAEMDSKNVHLRADLVSVLGEIKPVSPAAVDALAKVLDDPQLTFRATISLGEMGAPAKRAVPSLIEHLNRQNEYSICTRICESLWKIDKNTEHTVPALIDLVFPKTRMGANLRAIELLSQIGPPAKAAVPTLQIALTDKSKNVRITAADALWNINGKAESLIPVLVDVLKKKSPHLGPSKMRSRATQVLGGMGSAAKEAVPLLVELSLSESYEDESIRSDVYDALKEIDPVAARRIEPAMRAFD